MRTPLLMFLALACGLGAAFLAWRYISDKEGADPEIEVIVPIADIKPLMRLSDEKMFEKVMVKEKSLRDKNDVVRTFEELKDPADQRPNFKTRNYPLPAKKAFYKSDLTLHKDTDLHARMGPEDVGVTVQVAPTDAGAGLINPGDRVDIIAPIFQQGQQEPTFKMVFQDIEVLAVNSSTQPNPDQTALPPNSLILKVTRPLAESVIAYRSRGNLNVVLRKSGVTEIFNTPGAKPSLLVQGVGTDPQPGENLGNDDPSVSEAEKQMRAEFEARMAELKKQLEDKDKQIAELSKGPEPVEPPPAPVVEKKEEPTIHTTVVIVGDKRVEYKAPIEREKPGGGPGGMN
ncbi:MAG TPA: Flp pilus assembly protein CpaB [Gemmatales bacterium]|nr:Flp pilus assembly protein CpaB [Gemmatales bacterium]HMP59636.1 Flp pilus assembly protein CpaB [Gemmatales bacterium]